MAESNTEKHNQYLERQVHNLNKLVEINGIINATLDIGKLLTIIMETIKDIMIAEASTLLLYEEKTGDLVFKIALGEAGKELQERYRMSVGQGIAGWCAESRKTVVVNDVYSDDRFDPNFDKHTGFKTKAILCAPLLFKGKLLGVIEAINPLEKEGFDDDDLTLFKAFANQAVLAVQNAIFFQNALEEERIKNEIAAAQSLQESLLPEISDSSRNIQIAARAVSAREMGGGFYDISSHQDGTVRLALGDIHDKGIPGAMHASMISGGIKALSSFRGENPSIFIKTLNSFVSDIKTISRLSLFYGVVNPGERSIQFVNTGFSYPILVRDGLARYIRFGKQSPDEEVIKAKKVKVLLKSGDFFVIITDGIVNLKNRNSQRLGLKRIMDFLGGGFDTAENIVNDLLNFADEFTEGLEKREDYSIIAFMME
jgi:sigma-B regulation protein RsbU (phosphoserine phosphatase)